MKKQLLALLTVRLWGLGLVLEVSFPPLLATRARCCSAAPSASAAPKAGWNGYLCPAGVPAATLPWEGVVFTAPVHIYPPSSLWWLCPQLPAHRPAAVVLSMRGPGITAEHRGPVSPVRREARSASAPFTRIPSPSQERSCKGVHGRLRGVADPA